MPDPIITVESMSKRYRLGQIGATSLRESAERIWGSVRYKVKGIRQMELKHTPQSDLSHTEGANSASSPSTLHLVPYTNSSLRDELWALKDVSFEVQRGEVLGIIGRNGAGKSTLLKILSRITEPTSGRAILRGRVSSLLEVGTGFHPELTGRENIYLNGAILGMRRTEIAKKFDEIVAFAEVEKFIDTPVKRYSSGMYVRLAFAVAAHLEPEILIVDEVLAVGDASFQKKCLGKMDEVAKQGRTVLFVSHNMPAIQNLCMRVILLREGKIDERGLPNKVIAKYLNFSGGTSDLIVNLDDAERTKSRECAIKEAWLLNSAGELCRDVLMGERLTICYRYSTRSQIRRPGFGFGVDDMWGSRLFSASNYVMDRNPVEMAPIEGVVECKLDSVPLQPGSYKISLSLMEDSTIYVDYIEGALALNVSAADVYRTGRLFQPMQGVLFVKASVGMKK